MKQEIRAENALDANGNPSGGFVRGVGLAIDWQMGPLGRGPERDWPNGAFVEGVIQAAKQRLEFYQFAALGKFACEENQLAIEALDKALYHLNERTIAREKRGVEGTHKP